MWEELPEKQKEEYKKIILLFASFTELFSQKVDNEKCFAPIINSKFQETVFQKAFKAKGEDIGNTAYDASLKLENNHKYLIGIKTFGYGNNYQKIAQFKKESNKQDWIEIITKIQENIQELKTKNEINKKNKKYYKSLAIQIAEMRNKRIDSAIANIKGFNSQSNDRDVFSKYHVLMSSQKHEKPQIFVGETELEKIDIDKIKIIGCTGKNTPTNFDFTDEKHNYRYTNADSQLWMKFDNANIILESWDVEYVEDAFNCFKNLVGEISNKQITAHSEKIEESYSWRLDKCIHKYSGFNSFNSVGMKTGKKQRESSINNFKNKYRCTIGTRKLNNLVSMIENFLQNEDLNKDSKEKLREDIIKKVEKIKVENITEDVKKLVYRPLNEIYIPLPNSKKFHTSHPDFFGKGIGTFKSNSNTLALEKEQRTFTLIFEPSGDSIEAIITQDSGKAIMSYKKQTILGEWLLKKLFQLKDYELLTNEKLEEMHINGIRLYKLSKSDNIHLEFIYIDEDDLPADLQN